LFSIFSFFFVLCERVLETHSTTLPRIHDPRLVARLGRSSDRREHELIVGRGLTRVNSSPPRSRGKKPRRALKSRRTHVAGASRNCAPAPVRNPSERGVLHSRRGIERAHGLPVRSPRGSWIRHIVVQAHFGVRERHAPARSGPGAGAGRAAGVGRLAKAARGRRGPLVVRTCTAPARSRAAVPSSWRPRCACRGGARGERQRSAVRHCQKGSCRAPTARARRRFASGSERAHEHCRAGFRATAVRPRPVLHAADYARGAGCFVADLEPPLHVRERALWPSARPAHR